MVIIKKILSIILILSILFLSAACRKNDDPADNENGDTDSITEDVIEPGPVNPLRSVVNFSTEFALGYTLHNSTGNTFYYDMSYELFREEQGEWEQVLLRDNETALFSIDPGIIREYHVEWSDVARELGDTTDHIRIPPGRYMLVRKLFIDPQKTDEFEELRIEFDVFTQRDMILHRDSLRQKYLDFILSGPTSDNIILSGAVDVSQTGIAFSLENRSREEYVYGEQWDLVQSKDGLLQYVPPIIDNYGWVSILNTLRSGGIQRYEMQWEWLFGKLTPGRYAWIREYSPASEYPLPDRRFTKEYVVVVFVISDDTPEALAVTEDPHNFLRLTEYRNITNSGITVFLENVSDLDLRIHMYVGSIIHDGLWLEEAEDFFWPDYDTWAWETLPGNSNKQFRLDWSLSHGRLPPGEYDLIIVIFGSAPRPHPTGEFQEAFEVSANIQG